MSIIDDLITYPALLETTPTSELIQVMIVFHQMEAGLLHVKPVLKAQYEIVDCLARTEIDRRIKPNR